MSKLELGILFVGFAGTEAEPVANLFRAGAYRPVWSCVEAGAKAIECYDATGPDLVLFRDNGCDNSEIKSLLTELSVTRRLQSVGCKFIVVESVARPLAARSLFDAGADAVVTVSTLADLSQDYIRLITESRKTDDTGATDSPDSDFEGPRTEPDSRLLEQQVQSQRLETIGTLAGGIAHDFNNILAAIMGFAHSALLDVDEESGTAKDLNRIIGAAERAASLTSQIMAFSRRKKLNNEIVSFSTLVSEGLEMSRAAIPSNVIFRTEIDDDIGEMKADPTQWQQVILNLCLNAAQAMGEGGGTIVIGVRRVSVGAGAGNLAGDIVPGNYNELTISDNGSGMSDDVRQRIFEPFFTSRKPGKGTGLGMAVVHGIVTGHNGTISVESRMGEGAKITVLVPCFVSEGPSVKELKPVESTPAGRENILFVDDEKDIGTAYATPLRRLGYDVTVCESGIEALKLYHADPARFDLIITDQIMPELSGSDLAKKVAENGNGTPVMICSGYHTEKISELKNVPNVFEVLRKPVSPNKMGEAIRSIMDDKLPALKLENEYRSRH
jgi:signal transduction histidine kinase/ActR/RegA family two-component response regulator